MLNRNVSRTRVVMCSVLAAAGCLLVLASGGGAAIVPVYENSTAAGAYGAVSSTDLVNQGQATFSSLVESPPQFGAQNANDGAAATTGDDSTFWFSHQQPNTLTFTLNTAVKPLGYDITQIRTVAGWAGVTQSQANQDFELFVRPVGSPTFSSLGSFSHTPFPDTNSGGSYSTRITLTDDTGVIASGVDAVRFTYAVASFGGTAGLVIREIDIDGAPTAPIPVTSYQYDGTGQGSQPSTSPAFPDSGGVELTDGLFPSTTAFGNAQWVGFQDGALNLVGSHPQVTFALDDTYNLDQAAITYLHSTTQAGGSITAPDQLWVSVSDDGLLFSTPVLVAAPFDSSAGDAIRTAIVDMSAFSGQYVRLDLRNSSQWTFLTEVSFTGEVVPEPATLALAAVGLAGLRRPRRIGANVA